jgi:hypothetical protein
MRLTWRAAEMPKKANPQYENTRRASPRYR